MPDQTWGGTFSTASSFFSTLLTSNHPDDTEINTTRDAGAHEQLPVTATNAFQQSSTDSPKAGYTSDSASLSRLQEASGEGTAQAVRSSSTDSTTPAWKQKIIDKNEENKREINKIGDDFTDKAIVRIEGLSEEKREKAAEEYIRSTNYIMKGVKNIMDLSVSVTKWF